MALVIFTKNIEIYFCCGRVTYSNILLRIPHWFVLTPSHTSTENVENLQLSSINATTVSQLQQFFQQFYIRAKIFTFIFFIKIFADSVVACRVFFMMKRNIHIWIYYQVHSCLVFPALRFLWKGRRDFLLYLFCCIHSCQVVWEVRGRLQPLHYSEKSGI